MGATWLRWIDEQGNLILTGKELAERETARSLQSQAEAARAKADATQAQAEKEAAIQRAEKLAERLRQMGVQDV